jgi:hypothetical protein
VVSFLRERANLGNLGMKLPRRREIKQQEKLQKLERICAASLTDGETNTRLRPRHICKLLQVDTRQYYAMMNRLKLAPK